MCVDHVPSPAANARNKVQHMYTGPMDTELADSMCQCDPDVCLSHFCLSVYLINLLEKHP